MTIKFKFNLQKAIEVTSIILSQVGSKGMTAHKLLRYIYLIERCSWKNYDYPIIGGVNILRGTPINEDLYKVLFWWREVPEDIIKSQKVWDKYFIINRATKEDPKISSRDTIIYDDNLNESECCLIRDSCNYLKYLEINDTIFSFPEVHLVEMNYQTLDNGELLKILGKTEEEIEGIRLVSERENNLD